MSENDLSRFTHETLHEILCAWGHEMEQMPPSTVPRRLSRTARRVVAAQLAGAAGEGDRDTVNQLLGIAFLSANAPVIADGLGRLGSAYIAMARKPEAIEFLREKFERMSAMVTDDGQEGYRMAESLESYTFEVPLPPATKAGDVLARLKRDENAAILGALQLQVFVRGARICAADLPPDATIGGCCSPDLDAELVPGDGTRNDDRSLPFLRVVLPRAQGVRVRVRPAGAAGTAASADAPASAQP